MDQIDKEIYSLIANILKIPIDKISLNTGIDNQSDWDSLNHILIMNELEKVFEISLSPNDVINMINVESILNNLKKYIK
jgi:acyl carrier protein